MALSKEFLESRNDHQLASSLLTIEEQTPYREEDIGQLRAELAQRGILLPDRAAGNVALREALAPLLPSEEKDAEAGGDDHSERGTPERILVVLQNALFQFAPLNLAVGDVVLTDRAFYFLRYHEFPYAGGLGKGAGVLLGGVAGGIATSIQDKDAIQNARVSANLRRRDLYGFPLGERLKECGGSLVHSVGEIGGLRVSSECELSLAVQGGKQLAFVVLPMPEETQESVARWPASTVQYDRGTDVDGYFVGSASPRELVLRAAAGDADAGAELARLAQHQRYAFALYKVLRESTAAARKAVGAVFASAPAESRQPLIAAAKDDSDVGLIEIIGGPIGVAGAGLLVWFLWGEYTGTAVLLGGSLLLLSAFFIFEGIGRRRRAKDVVACIQPGRARADGRGHGRE